MADQSAAAPAFTTFTLSAGVDHARVYSELYEAIKDADEAMIKAILNDDLPRSEDLKFIMASDAFKPGLFEHSIINLNDALQQWQSWKGDRLSQAFRKVQARFNALATINCILACATSGKFPRDLIH